MESNWYWGYKDKMNNQELSRKTFPQGNVKANIWINLCFAEMQKTNKQKTSAKKKQLSPN